MRKLRATDVSTDWSPICSNTSWGNEFAPRTTTTQVVEKVNEAHDSVKELFNRKPWEGSSKTRNHVQI